LNGLACNNGGKSRHPRYGRPQDATVALYVGNLKVAETVSDDFGDFRFDGLARDSGGYRIEIRHALGHAWRNCQLGESVYLGEVSLARVTNGAEVA